MHVFHEFMDTNFCRLFLQICRVEDIDIAGLVEGSVVHFHRARTVIIHALGTISASGLGIVSYYGFFSMC